jgi:4-hydroxy-3-methylbut-2-en-1-yl diphosphate reductase
LPPVIFRKGLDLKHEVAGVLADSYHSPLIERIRNGDHRYESGELTIHLAREFGFCYGVDRAVDYAYQARRRFPHQTVYLTGEIIHNPHVNDQLRAQGIRFLSDPGESPDRVTSGDVVILPAFGVRVDELAEFVRRGCTLVDTTCGSVLNVWKNVRRYAQDGFTSVIHGKYWHEETRATASQAVEVSGGQYLVVLDRAEAALVCDYIRGRSALSREALMVRLAAAVSDGFDPEVHLTRIGSANQTTMLSSESLAIGEMFREAIRDRYGASELEWRFRAFDTICSATQDRQDAIAELLARHPLDLAIVVGGYNSSNTCNLARMCADRVPTFHISEPAALLSASEIRHRSVAEKREIVTRGWLPRAGPVVVGLTSGASTPNNLMEAVVTALDRFVNDCRGGLPAARTV